MLARTMPGERCPHNDIACHNDFDWTVQLESSGKLISTSLGGVVPPHNDFDENIFEVNCTYIAPKREWCPTGD